MRLGGLRPLLDHGAFGEFPEPEPLAAVQEGQAAIQPLPHGDRLLGEVKDLVLTSDLEVPVAPADRPVVLDEARFLEAEHFLERQPRRNRPVQIAVLPGREGEAPVQVWQELVMQVLVRGLYR